MFLFSSELGMAWVFLGISLGKPMPSLAQMRRVLHSMAFSYKRAGDRICLVFYNWSKLNMLPSCIASPFSWIRGCLQFLYSLTAFPFCCEVGNTGFWFQLKKKPSLLATMGLTSLSTHSYFAGGLWGKQTLTWSVKYFLNKLRNKSTRAGSI